MSRMVGNIVSTVIAVVVGAVTMWGSYHFLKLPEDGIDWMILLLAGLTTGTVAFFISWGHFQGEPQAERPLE